MLLCFLLYALSSSRNISPHFCSVSSFFLVFYFYCSHDAVCLFLNIFQYFLFWYFSLLKVMLSCGAAIFHSSPTSNTSVKTVLIIFNISTFFLFELLSVWHGYSAIRTSLQFSRPNSSNDFIELGWCLWGFVLFINNIYKLFYVLPFFDIIFQLLNLYPYILNHLFVM